MSKPMLLTMFWSDEYEAMYLDHERLHKEYADMHGYRLRHLRLADPENDQWNYMLEMAEVLAGPDPPEFLAYLDADAFIKRPEVDLRDALPSWAWFGCVAHALPLYGYETHLCVGVQYWRPNPKAVRFIRELCDRREEWMASPQGSNQLGINRMLMEERDWQSGFVLLGNDWNLNWNQFRTATSVVIGWHGYDKGTDRDRRVEMNNVMRKLNLPLGRVLS